MRRFTPLGPRTVTVQAVGRLPVRTTEPDPSGVRGEEHTMVMSVGRTPVGADPSRASPETGTPARRSRRDLLLGLFGPAAVAVALTPVVLASRAPRAAE